MSFLADPPSLVAAGAAIERLVDDDERADRLALGVTAVFMTGAAALYFDAPGLRWMYRPFRSASGRDFMLNHGVLRVPHDPTPWWAHAGAAVLLASYPLWLRLGRRIGNGGAVRRLGRARP
jgi:hypothetical protein